jgi:hypothetical protein
MDEKEILAGLRGLSLPEPELGFNPDDVATKAAKRQRNRRATLATGAGTFAVAGAAVAIMIFNGATDALLPLTPAGGATTSRHPTSSRVTIPKPPSPEHDLAVQMARNKMHLLDVLPTLLPGAKEVAVPQARQDYPSEPEGWDITSYSTFFRDEAGPAEFNFVVFGKVSTRLSSGQEKCDTPAPKCQEFPQADGSVVVIKTEAGGSVRTATHYRKDGTKIYIDNGKGISLSLVNHYHEGEPGTKRSRFPLNDQQLIALATDPAFNLN